MMDGDLLMILTVTVNVMMMMMTIKTMIMKRGSCQENNSLQFFFFAMHHCSVSRSSWSFKRRALTEVTRHARWVMKSLFSCNLVPRFFESRWTKARQRKIEFACSLSFIPFFRSWAHLSTYIPWQRLKQRYAQGLKNVITAPEALPLWYFKEIWIKLKNQYLHQFQI